jgi:hypothetical protein
MEDVFKANSLGLALMNVVGEAVLREAVNMLRADISADPKPIVQSIETLSLLRDVDFTKFGKQIVYECVFVANKIRDNKLQAVLEDAYKRLAEMELPDHQKVLLLSGTLVGFFGEAILKTVLKSLPPKP